jgi:hypothetical protein
MSRVELSLHRNDTTANNWLFTLVTQILLRFVVVKFAVGLVVFFVECRASELQGAVHILQFWVSALLGVIPSRRSIRCAKSYLRP